MNSQAAQSPRWKISSYPSLLLMLAAALSLFFSCFRLPLIPIWQSYDQFGFIEMASRIWNGQIFYRDFQYVTFPGHELVYLLFFRLFGLRNWIPSADLIVVGLVLTWLIAYTGSNVIKGGRFLPLLPAALFLMLAFTRSVQDSHRWLSSAALLAALAVVLEERAPRRLAVAGILCGISSFFTQTQGVATIAGLAVFLCWEGHIKKEGWRRTLQRTVVLVAPFVATVVVTNAYFVWKAGLTAFLYSTIRYPAIYFPLDRVGGSFQAYISDLPVGGGPLIPLLRGLAPYLVIYALVPFAYLATLIWYWLRGQRNEEGLRVLLVSVVGLCAFAGVARSPSYFRLCTVSAPALILCVYFLQSKRALQRAIVVCLWIACMFSLIHRPILVQASSWSVLQLPAGPVAFASQEAGDSDYQMLDWLSVNTRPGELFFSTCDAGITFPVALRLLGESGYDDNGTTPPQSVQSAIATLEKYDVRLIQWPPCQTPARYYHPDEDHLAPLRKYVQANYRMIESFGGNAGSQRDEIWERKK